MKIVKLYKESQFNEKSKGDLGYDCHAVVPYNDLYHVIDGKKLYNIEPGQTKKVSLGIKVGFSEGTAGFLKERSGLASTGVHILGGVIDNSYTGEVSAVVYNSSKKDFKVFEGDRICQLVLIPLLHEEVEEVDKLEETDRGEKGFGASGGYTQPE